MDIKRIIFSFLALAITLTVSAQKRERKAVVLNDGTVIAGTIIADSSDFLKVRIKRPQVIILNKSMVYSTGKVRHSMTNPPEKRGYSIRLSASLLAGRNNSGGKGSMSMHLSNSYQFRSGFGAGFGTGIEKLDVLVMPVYGELSFQPLKTRLSPFVWMKGGYGIPLSEKTGDDYYYYNRNPKSTGGMMFNAGAGLALYTWNRTAVSIGIGYRYQELVFGQNDSWYRDRLMQHNELVTYFERIEVQFGFIFR